jgi:hypothetical protein
MEYSFERCIESTHARGRLVDKFSNIVDLEGLGVKHRNLAKYVKAIAKVDEANYPETMGHTFIVNAPWIFTAMFNIIKYVCRVAVSRRAVAHRARACFLAPFAPRRGWLDPVTASKVFVLGSDYKETLLQHYSPEELPKEYGGTAEGEIIRVFSEEVQCCGLALGRWSFPGPNPCAHRRSSAPWTSTRRPSTWSAGRFAAAPRSRSAARQVRSARPSTTTSRRWTTTSSSA